MLLCVCQARVYNKHTAFQHLRSTPPNSLLYVDKQQLCHFGLHCIRRTTVGGCNQPKKIKRRDPWSQQPCRHHKPARACLFDTELCPQRNTYQQASPCITPCCCRHSTQQLLLLSRLHAVLPVLLQSQYTTTALGWLDATPLCVGMR